MVSFLLLLWIAPTTEAHSEVRSELWSKRRNGVEGSMLGGAVGGSCRDREPDIFRPAIVSVCHADTSVRCSMENNCPIAARSLHLEGGRGLVVNGDS